MRLYLLVMVMLCHVVDASIDADIVDDDDASMLSLLHMILLLMPPSHLVANSCEIGGKSTDGRKCCLGLLGTNIMMS